MRGVSTLWLWLLLATVTTACDVASTHRAASLEVVQTVPEPDAELVALSAHVRATFDRPLDPSTVTPQTFHMDAAGDVFVEVSGHTARFVPLWPLRPSTTYTVTLTQGLAGADGTRLAVPVVFRFSTGAHGAAVAPAVRALSPPPDAADVPVHVLVTADFASDMNPFSIDVDTVLLHDGDASGALVAASVAYRASVRRVLLAPLQALEFDHTYTVEVTDEVRAATGQRLGAAVLWGFRTEDVLHAQPPATRAIPPAGAYGEPVVVSLQTDKDGAAIWAAVDEPRVPLDDAHLYDPARLRLATEGRHVLRFRAADGAGHVESEKAVEYLIDLTAPRSRITPLERDHRVPPEVALAAEEAFPEGLVLHYRLVPGPDVECLAETADEARLHVYTGPFVLDAPEGFLTTVTVCWLARDAVGHREAARGHAYRIDRRVLASRADPPGGVFNRPIVVALSVSGSASAWVEHSLRATDRPEDFTRLAPGGVVDLPTDGVYHLRYRAADETGNAEAAVHEEVYVVDVTPPASWWSGDAPGTYRRDVDVVLQSQDSPRGAASVWYTLNAGAVLDDAGVPRPDARRADGPLHLVAVPGQDYEVEVLWRARDEAGNVEPIEHAGRYRLDARAPASTVSPPPLPGGHSSRPMVVTVTTDPEATARWRFAGDAAWQDEGGASASIDLPGEGAWTLESSAIDPTGNEEPPRAWTWRVDWTPPRVEVYPAPGYSRDAVGVTWRTEPEGTVHYRLLRDATPPSPRPGDPDSVAWREGVPPVDLLADPTAPDARWCLSWVAADRAGNTSAPMSACWTIDQRPPVPVITIDGPGPTRDGIRYLNAPGHLTVVVPGERELLWLRGGVFDTPGATPTEPYAGEVPLTQHTNGPHAFVAQATDAAGNVGSVVEQTFEVDLHPPGIVVPRFDSSCRATWTWSPPADDGGVTTSGRVEAYLLEINGADASAMAPRPTGPGGHQSVTTPAAHWGETVQLRLGAIDDAGHVSPFSFDEHAVDTSLVPLDPPLDSPPLRLLGSTVVGLGDIDRDGFADFAAGAEREDGAGAIVIYFGSSLPSKVQGRIVFSTGNPMFGSRLAALDFDADGVTDIATIESMPDGVHGTILRLAPTGTPTEVLRTVVLDIRAGPIGARVFRDRPHDAVVFLSPDVIHIGKFAAGIRGALVVDSIPVAGAKAIQLLGDFFGTGFHSILVATDTGMLVYMSHGGGMDLCVDCRMPVTERDTVVGAGDSDADGLSDIAVMTSDCPSRGCAYTVDLIKRSRQRVTRETIHVGWQGGAVPAHSLVLDFGRDMLGEHVYFDDRNGRVVVAVPNLWSYGGLRFSFWQIDCPDCGPATRVFAPGNVTGCDRGTSGFPDLLVVDADSQRLWVVP